MTNNNFYYRVLETNKILDYYQNLAIDIKQRLTLYLTMLKTAGLKHNLTGIKSDDLLFEKFILESLVPFCLALDFKNKSILDLGTGAGLPGMILALVTSQNQFTLVDKSQVKVKFQHAVIKKLALTHVTALCLNFDNRYDRQKFDYVFARAYKPLGICLDHAFLALKPNGLALLWKGKNWQTEFSTVKPELLKKFDLIEAVRYNISDLTGGLLLIIRRL